MRVERVPGVRGQTQRDPARSSLHADVGFCDLPDFDAAALDAAIESYRQRERRFGRTSEQLVQQEEPVARTSVG